MGSEETKVYAALLIACFIFLAVVIAFLITIISYQRKSVSAYLDRMKADLGLLERERMRMASDLHDELGSQLSALKLMIEDFASANQEKDVLRQRLIHTIGDMMLSVRQLSNNMVPYALQREGLLVSLNELIETLFSGSSIKVTSEWKIKSSDISKEYEIHIYRIVQELFTNIIKHANADRIEISLRRVKNIVHLDVSDNGIGFHQKAVQKSAKGLGLRNILARINVMKGSLYLTTHPGEGTTYQIELPAH